MFCVRPLELPEKAPPPDELASAVRRRLPVCEERIASGIVKFVAGWCDGAQCDRAVVGHAILVFFATVGFLYAYLWTRRYFIHDWMRGYFDLYYEELRRNEEYKKLKESGLVMEKPKLEGLRKLLPGQERKQNIIRRLAEEERQQSVPEPLKFASLGVTISSYWQRIRPARIWRASRCHCHSAGTYRFAWTCAILPTR